MNEIEQFALLCLVISLATRVEKPKEDLGIEKLLFGLFLATANLAMLIFGTLYFAYPKTRNIILALLEMETNQ